MSSEPMLAHNVYWTLKDNTAAARQKLIDDSKKYLAAHPGIVSFAVGTLAEAMNRSINDRSFDVSLHILFRTAADHDHYQAASPHREFITANNANWKQVRIFDSIVEPVGV